MRLYNIRDYSQDKHRRVDDTPYGGGKGMLMMAPPIFNCYEGILEDQKKESFEPQSISSAPRAKTTHLSRSTKLQGEACGTATARAWCGGARVPRDPGGQPEPPAPRSPPWPLGSFSRLACAPPRAPGGGEAQSAGTKRQMKVNECLKVEKPPVRGEGGRRPSTDGWRRSHHPWVPARRHPSREISKPRPLPPQSFSPQLSISF